MAKAVFSDIDGTLITYDKKLSPRTVAAIKALQKKRIPFVAITGRAAHCASPLFEKYDLSVPVIGCSGGVCQKADGGMLWEEGFSFAESYDLIKYLKQNHKELVPCIYTKEHWYAEDINHPYVQLEQSVVSFPPLQADFSTLVDGPIINKLLLMMPDEILPVVMENLKINFPFFKFVASASCLIEVLPLNVDKGLAIKKYCDMMNIDIKEALAFGDHQNDIELLSAAGESYAVKNATNELKSVAKYVCDACYNDGVAKVLEKVFEI